MRQSLKLTLDTHLQALERDRQQLADEITTLKAERDRLRREVELLHREIKAIVSKYASP